MLTTGDLTNVLILKQHEQIIHDFNKDESCFAFITYLKEKGVYINNYPTFAPMKYIANFLLWLSGWKVDYNMPAEHKRAVVIAAPHTTNWDFYYVRLAFWALGVPMKVAIKNDWTKFPFGLFVKAIGGVGVDRSPKQKGEPRKSQVDAMAELFNQYDEIGLVIAPEGTRKRVKRWKMGYYWVAKAASVPIVCGYLDYENKVAGIGSYVLYPKGDIASELRPIMDFYSDIKGKHPEQFQVDERYS